MRLKYIASRNEGDALFWGLNGEMGHAVLRASESASVFELRPIVGYRANDWLVSFNPILKMGLSANVSRQPSFEPSLKLSKRVAEGVHTGAEYFGEYGPLRRFVPSSERSHMLYAVIDVEKKGYDINLGVGRGFVNASDRWVIKAVVAKAFN
jgi:hypothetical protein